MWLTSGTTDSAWPSRRTLTATWIFTRQCATLLPSFFVQWGSRFRSLEPLESKTAPNHRDVAPMHRHGIGRTWRHVLTGNCGHAAGPVDEHELQRAGALNAQFDLDSRSIGTAGGCVGKIDCPFLAGIPTRLSRRAERMPIYLGIDNFGVRRRNGNDRRTTR